MVVRSPTQRNLGLAELGPAAFGDPPEWSVAAPTSAHRNNVLQFPDEIEQAVRSRIPPAPPAVQAAPNAWENPHRWPSFADVHRRAQAERAAFLGALCKRMGALCGAILHKAVLRRPEIFGCVVLIVVFVALFGAKSADLIGPAECHASPVMLGFGHDLDAQMTAPAGTACSLPVKAAMASFDQLEVTAPPQHGAVTLRGRTGVIYRPEPQYTGDDFFAFVPRGQSARRDGMPVVRVSVTVK